MATRLNPYLHFRDNAREALEFYRSALGGELVISTFADGGMPHDGATANMIMHGQLETPAGFTLMGSDTPPGMDFQPGTNYAVSVTGDDDAELRGYWDRLSDGAAIGIPLAKAPWGDTFGQLVDKFGVAWMVNITGAGN